LIGIQNGDVETYETDLREIIVQQLHDMLIEEKPVDALTLPPELKGYGILPTVTPSNTTTSSSSASATSAPSSKPT